MALDGKTARASMAESQPPLHVVSAFSTTNRLVVAQPVADAKNNEITAIPALLKLLGLKGCIITVDSMGRQRDVAKKAVGKWADYILAAEGEQAGL